MLFVWEWNWLPLLFISFSFVIRTAAFWVRTTAVYILFILLKYPSHLKLWFEGHICEIILTLILIAHDGSMSQRSLETAIEMENIQND